MAQTLAFSGKSYGNRPHEPLRVSLRPQSQKFHPQTVRVPRSRWLPRYRPQSRSVQYHSARAMANISLNQHTFDWVASSDSPKVPSRQQIPAGLHASPALILGSRSFTFRCWQARVRTPSLTVSLVRQQGSIRAADGSSLLATQDCPDHPPHPELRRTFQHEAPGSLLPTSSHSRPLLHLLRIGSRLASRNPLLVRLLFPGGYWPHLLRSRVRAVAFLSPWWPQPSPANAG